MSRIAQLAESSRDLITDSLMNLISGLGTDKDKSTQTFHQFTPLTQGQVETAYRSDWLARKIVDIPAHDATREWREWHGDEEQIKAIEEAEAELELRQKVSRWLIAGRLYGGAGLILGLRGQNPIKPLDPESVGEGDLLYVHALNRFDLTEQEVVWDLEAPNYGMPEFFNLGGNTASVMIHSSRVVPLIPRPIPDNQQISEIWGDSVLQTCLSAVNQFSSTLSAAGALVHEAKVDIIKVDDLLLNSATEDKRRMLTERFHLASQTKSLLNTLLLDTKEEWQRQDQTFTELANLLQMFMLSASGAADIPITRLLGQSPAGLQSTGESDLRNYYDAVGATQRTLLQPALRDLDEVLIRSALGDRPDDIDWRWRPLWAMSEVEQAEVAKRQAEIYQIDAAVGLENSNVLVRARRARLLEDDTYPGLDAIIDEFGELEDLDEMDEADPLVMQQQQAMMQAAGGDPELLASMGPPAGGEPPDPDEGGGDEPEEPEEPEDEDDEDDEDD